MSKSATYCGFVAIVGAPNAGKSTLLNRLLGQKLAIVSAKPQTTRTRLLGILNEGQTQICMLDTPGIFAPKNRLDRAMVGMAWQSLAHADAILLLLDATRGYDGKTRKIIERLQQEKRQALLVLNKIDAMAKAEILPLAQELFASGIFTESFMISAKNGDGVGDLKRYLGTAMPAGDWLFAADQLTDMPSSLVAAEITREQLYHQLAQELPYAAAVIPTGWHEQKDGSLRIEQQITVMRDTQRAIVIGKGGERLKQIGTAARLELNKFFGRTVHLFLDVVVEPDWQNQRGFYRMFGFDAFPQA
jgi:GTPase